MFQKINNTNTGGVGRLQGQLQDLNRLYLAHRIQLSNFYAKYIMRNAGLDEAQAGIKIAGKNINNLRYADDTTLMAESEEELKSLMMKVKEESETFGLKLNIQKMKIMASGPTANRWGNSGNSVRLYFSGLQNQCRW